MTNKEIIEKIRNEYMEETHSIPLFDFDFILKDIQKALDQKDKQMREIRLTEYDVQDIGDHYWGGDYEPSYSELCKMKDIINKKLDEKQEQLNKLN